MKKEVPVVFLKVCPNFCLGGMGEGDVLAEIQTRYF
jgi:hypothetical protein